MSIVNKIRNVLRSGGRGDQVNSEDDQNNHQSPIEQWSAGRADPDRVVCFDEFEIGTGGDWFYPNLRQRVEFGEVEEDTEYVAHVRNGGVTRSGRLKVSNLRSNSARLNLRRWVIEELDVYPGDEVKIVLERPIEAESASEADW